MHLYYTFLSPCPVNPSNPAYECVPFPKSLIYRSIRIAIIHPRHIGIALFIFPFRSTGNASIL